MVFTDNRPASFLIAAARQWVLGSRPPATPPLTAAQVEAFVLSSPTARELAETVSRTWKEYAAAEGREQAQYDRLAEALLNQQERGNPSAAHGFLWVARSPFGWGLYRLTVRWYDENGWSVIAPNGVYCDHTYAAFKPLKYAIRVVIDDPQMYTLVTFLRQAISEGAVDAASLEIPGRVLAVLAASMKREACNAGVMQATLPGGSYGQAAGKLRSCHGNAWYSQPPYDRRHRTGR